MTKCLFSFEWYVAIYVAIYEIIMYNRKLTDMHGTGMDVYYYVDVTTYQYNYRCIAYTDNIILDAWHK